MKLKVGFKRDKKSPNKLVRINPKRSRLMKRAARRRKGKRQPRTTVMKRMRSLLKTRRSGRTKSGRKSLLRRRR